MKAPMKRKGMNDIKTHAGTVDQTFLPHKAYMRISCLEMEKAHRIREMESSRRRIEAVKKRLKEIETETDTLMNRIKADTKEGSIADTKEGGILSKIKQPIRTKDWCSGISNSSAPPPDLPHPFGFAQDRRGGGNVFPPPLVGGDRGGGELIQVLK